MQDLEGSRRLVRAFFEAVTAGALPDSLLTPDMRGWTTHSGSMDKAAYQGVIELLAGISEKPLRFTIDAITAEEDRAVAEVRSSGTLLGGEDYANTYVYAFRFRDGRIASVAEHYNALIVEEKMMPLLRGGQPQEATSREANLAAVKRYFDGVAAASADRMLEAWTDDLVYEERFSDPPRRIEGKPAARTYFSKAGKVFRMTLELTAVHECLDPDELVLEYTSQGQIVTTGDAYRNSYIGVYRFRDGRIWRVREFHNPLITQRARPPGVVIEQIEEG